MTESRNYYNKGMKYFHKGELDKAIANLDIAISHDIKNSAALNLRGMIYYIKGNVDKALNSWKINIDFNNDDIARNYIQSYENDEINDYRYKKALNSIKAFDIDEAVSLLEEASRSDYNIINVRNALAFCYMKQLNFEKAKSNSEIVLDKDCQNRVAKENLEIIKKELGIKINVNVKKYSIFLVIAIIVVSAGTVLKMTNTVPSVGLTSEKSEKDENIEKEQINKEPTKPQVADEQKQEENEDKSDIYNVELLKSAVQNRDFDNIDKNLKGIDKNNLSENDKKVIENATKIMKKEGLENFYERARNEFKDKNFSNAKDIFIKATDYSKGSYLEEHIIYMTAVSFEALKDVDSAAKYYEKYIDEDYNGSYTAEVLYNLALIYEKKDMSKSKDYAYKIINEYSDSIYNNDNIKSILNR